MQIDRIYAIMLDKQSYLVSALAMLKIIIN